MHFFSLTLLGDSGYPFIYFVTPLDTAGKVRDFVLSLPFEFGDGVCSVSEVEPDPALFGKASSDLLYCREGFFFFVD